MSRVKGRKPPPARNVQDDAVIAALFGATLQLVEDIKGCSTGVAADGFGREIYAISPKFFERILEAVSAHRASERGVLAVAQMDQVVAALEQIKREAVS